MTSEKPPRSNSNEGGNLGNLGIPGSLNTTLHMTHNLYPRYLEE